MRPLEAQVAEAHAVYTPFTLSAYDAVVHGFTNPFVWGCSTRVLVEWHARHVARRHCEVGVGTGYLLEHARAGLEQLTLVDLNETCLQRTAARLADKAPRCVRANVLEPLPQGVGPFDSIGLGYLLHCVPGDFGGAKGAAFGHLGSALADGGVVFGSTVLGASDAPSLRARALMRLYNARGIFHNQGDTMRGLILALSERFVEHEVHRVGAVALFAARGFRKG